MVRIPKWMLPEVKYEPTRPAPEIKPITLRVVRPETKVYVGKEELKERAGDILWEVKGIMSELEDIERSLDEIKRRLEIIRKRAKYLVERL